MDSTKMVDFFPSVIKEKISSSEAEEYKKNLLSVGAEIKKIRFYSKFNNDV